MHSVTDRQTDDRMMPIADHALQQYDRLKIDKNVQVRIFLLLPNSKAVA